MATLQEQLNQLSDEELNSLEQAFIKKIAANKTNLSPQGQGILGDMQRKRRLAGIEGFGRGMLNARGIKLEDKDNSQEITNVPEGFEIIGYDQKGRPMIRKIQINVAEEKFNIEQEEKKSQQQEKSQFVKDSALDTLNTIEEVEKGIGHFGLIGQLPSIPGTERATWEANVNKLLSGKIINLMTQMKEASRTGATGFGQLSEKELKVLQESSTALKRGLSPESAQLILNDMKAKIKKITQEETSQDNLPVKDNDPLGIR